MRSEAAFAGASEKIVIKMETPITNVINLDRFIFSPPFLSILDPAFRDGFYGQLSLPKLQRFSYYGFRPDV
jgi:hypothetical protein